MNKVFFGDCRDSMRQLMADGIRVQTCVTSPPYFGLRSYLPAGHPDKHLELGLENSPKEYVENMVEVFRLVRELLSDDGTLWCNLGDSYGPHKQLHGIPWRVALALQDDGWILRQDIIWSKKSCMPESVTDRCTKSHEYIFLLSKSARYYFDQEAIKVPLKDTSIARLIQDIENQRGSGRVPGKTNGNMKAVGRKDWDPKIAGGGSKVKGHKGYFDSEGNPICGSMANKKSVWEIAPQPYSEAHFATFPPALIEPCILAGSRPGDIVLDPFIGSGTTGEVSQNLGRRWIGCELNPAYAPLQKKRTEQTGLMFA